MVKILILSLSIIFTSCGRRNKLQILKDCTPTAEYIKSKNYKTSGIVFSDGYEAKLYYVKPQEYNKRNFCYGFLETTQDTIAKIAAQLNISHNPKDIFTLNLYGKNHDLCNSEKVLKENITAYCVCYKDKEKNALLDYINLQSGTKETYRVSAYYASTTIYFLQFRTGITSNPFIIDIKNANFMKDRDIFNYIDRSDDTLQDIVEKNRIR